ncbi:MAG: aminopeptidase [Tannerella sp.]|jgi:aminopeptidase N|nr:aminopeptidase [Tannerella sp.]
MNPKCPFLFFILIVTLSCTSNINKLNETGVSLELAQFRKTEYKDINYTLWFSIPKKKHADVQARAEIQLTLKAHTPIILDFTGNANDVQELKINETTPKYTVENQHIIIPENFTIQGKNNISVKFTAGDQSLNRRDDFVYTLLVPDRARTLFPCFDQPNLKAVFNLRLNVPEAWEAIGNSNTLVTKHTFSEDRKEICFHATEPIGTYLFSFVAGKFEKFDDKKNDREITLYHRETDPDKISQCHDIINEVFHSLEWMEEYTGINYPFGKYDLIILPGFQYGGMEHTGATLYNDKRMFLDKNATAADSLNRSKLIAHETAHMWFGDYVTMEWFNDVWNKEVFANWFAAQIVSPMYPSVNHDLNFIISYYPSAYAEDRTTGAMPIQQPLDNLRNAGLIYSNIVYNKSPIVMEMLIKKIGHEYFREAIREYLHKYAYGNSDWDKLIKILNGKTQDDLLTWSNTWIKEKGMPTISFTRNGDKVNITQSDSWNMNRFWPINFSFNTYSVKTGYQTHTVQLMANNKTAEILMSDEDYYILPNSDGKGYGYFKTDSVNSKWLLENWGQITNSTLRFATLVNLYESIMHLDLSPEAFLESIIHNLDSEANPQIFRQALTYAERCAELFTTPNSELRGNFEDYLFNTAEKHTDQSYRTLTLKSFCRLASSEKSLNRLYHIWKNPAEAAKYRVSEYDLIEISYILSMYDPENANDILQKQLSRITNPDRRKEYEFVMQALAPVREQREEFFYRLLLPESWAVEAWSQTALKWLNHPVRYPESLGYIRPALDILCEIQREGDIFFPANWCSALFSGHTSPEALDLVNQFFADNPDYPKLLESKIRLRADHLYLLNGHH